MTSGTQSGIITFLDKDYNLKALEQAISKSNETYIEPGKEIHPTMFVQSEIELIGWANKFKKPVVTIYEGKYVIIVRTDVLNDCWENGPDDKIIIKKGFKAKFVTKYNFNQSKVAEVVEAPPVTAAPAIPVYQDRRPPQWKPNNGFQRNQTEGYSGHNRNNTRRDK